MNKNSRHIKMAWIPKSSRGRLVARAIRNAGFDLPGREILGRFGMNIPGSWEFPGDLWEDIANILDPEAVLYLGGENETFRKGMEGAGK